MSITQIVVQSPANETLFTDTAISNVVDAVKNSSTRLLYLTVDNSNNIAASYVKLFNLASGSVTLGTTIPDKVIYIPGSAIITEIFYTSSTPGLTFGTALSAACVTAGGTAGITGPSSSVIVTIAYV